MNIEAEVWENLDISNDYIFGKVMQDEELCGELIRRILPDIEIGRIEFPERQKAMAEGVYARSVRLDIYTRSEFGHVIDIEMQMLHSGNLPKRTRAYHTIMDMNAMNKNLMKNYNDFPMTFVIFICAKFDPFNKGRHIYTFQNICKEDPLIQLNDGTFTIFLTPKGTKNDVSEKLTTFLDLVSGKSSDDPFVKRLEAKILEVKQSPELKMEFMSLYMRDQDRINIGMQRGIQKGIQQGKFEERKAMVQQMKREGLPLDMIARVAGENVSVIQDWIN